MRHASKSDNDAVLEMLHAIGMETDVRDIKMRNVLGVLSIIWSQFLVADRDWVAECQERGWEMPRHPHPRNGAIWNDAELTYARSMLKTKSMDEVARALGRSIGAVEKATSNPTTAPPMWPAPLGMRPAKNQPLRQQTKKED